MSSALSISKTDAQRQPCGSQKDAHPDETAFFLSRTAEVLPIRWATSVHCCLFPHRNKIGTRLAMIDQGQTKGAR
jgi:hypothetical protein